MQEYKVLENKTNTQQIIEDHNGVMCYGKKEETYDIHVFDYLYQHPNKHIPKILSYEEKEDGLYVVEEYVEGMMLTEALQENLSFDERLDILNQILDGVRYLHLARPTIIHRDITVDNIMIDVEGVVKIIDYDASKTYSQTDKLLDTREDIYDLGVLISLMFPDNLKMLEIATTCISKYPYTCVEEIMEAIESFNKKEEDGFQINIPGFRTGKLSHMLIASVGYVIILATAVEVEATWYGRVVDNIIFSSFYKIMSGLEMLSWVDIFTNWTGLFKHFPLLKSKNVLLRVLGYLLAIFFSVFVMTMILMIAAKILGID